MFKLDDNLLQELGLGSLPPQEKNRMLQHIYETLEMRVGMRLAEGMSNQQLDEFEKLMPVQTDTEEVRKQKEQEALRWLEANFPNYKQVVADELEKLKAEVKASAAQIVAAAQQAPQGQVPPPPMAA
jgi:predicted RNA-binding Zn ribbon-like protein